MLFYLFLFLLLAAPAYSQELAFPGAEGFGRFSKGGNGSPVVLITNLLDDRYNPPAGSARHCLETLKVPRICRAAVTGWVELPGQDIIVRHPYVTFEGVANGHRLGFKGAGVFVRASHTIWRNATILPGTLPLRTAPYHNANGIFLWSDELGQRTSDHIIDHSTVGYTTDDSLGVNAQRVTIQDSILGPSLACNQINGVPCGGKGILLQGSDATTSLIRILQVHTYIRFPEIQSGKADFINSVSYNGHGTDAQINTVYGLIEINFVGNVFRKGPNTYSHLPGSQPYNPYQSIRTKGGLTYSSVSKIHVRDNIGKWWEPGWSVFHQDDLAVPDKAIIWGDDGGIPVSDTFLGTGLSLINPPMPSSQVLDYVLAHVGVFPRSAFETRMINEVRTQTGNWPKDEAAYGGWAVLTGDGAVPPPLPPPVIPPVIPPVVPPVTPPVIPPVPPLGTALGPVTDAHGRIFTLVGPAMPYQVYMNGAALDQGHWAETLQLDAGEAKVKENLKLQWWVWKSTGGWILTSAPSGIIVPPVVIPPVIPPVVPSPVEARLAKVEAILAAIKLEVCKLTTTSTMRTALRRAVGGCTP